MCSFLNKGWLSWIVVHSLDCSIIKSEYVTEMTLSNAYIIEYENGAFIDNDNIDENKRGVNNLKEENTTVALNFYALEKTSFNLYLIFSTQDVNKRCMSTFMLNNITYNVTITKNPCNRIEIGNFEIFSPGYHKILMKRKSQYGNLYPVLNMLTFEEYQGYSFIQKINNAREIPGLTIWYQNVTEGAEYFYKEFLLEQSQGNLSAEYNPSYFKFGRIYFTVSTSNYKL